MIKRHTIFSVVGAVAVSLLLSNVTQAQIASAFVREADALGTGVVASISNTATNRVGGYAVTLNIDDGTSTISTVYGDAAGGAPAIMRQEGTFGDLTQNNFESFFGISDSGQVSYSASTDNSATGSTGLDGVWLDDVVQSNEEDASPAAPGEFVSFGSRPGVTADGKPFWVGGLTDSVGGGSLDRALYLDGNILLRGNDNVGVPEPVTMGGGIDFDFRFSAMGTNYISPIDVQAASTEDLVITVNGTAVSPGGSVMREGSPLPVSLGGDGVENWDNFDFMGINEAGDYFVTGDTDSADTGRDEFVSFNGNVVLREGDMVGGLILSGSIEGGYMNEDGDWAVIWDVDNAGANVEALIVNGDLVLLETDLVDWNGDGNVDGADSGFSITNFTGISALTLSERDANGNVSAFFTADAVNDNGLDLEGAFSVTVAIPEPSSFVFFASAMLGLFVVRRK
jgi:hypothetical protein